MPNGELSSTQLRRLADCIRPYGADGCGDITTRANIQLRGITMEDASAVVTEVQDMGLTSFMTGMDNVRNLTGSPIAGLDPEELLDVRPMLVEMQARLFPLMSLSQACISSLCAARGACGRASRWAWELIEREWCVQDLITNHGKGRADLTNMPRKINICVSPTRDDFPHTHINDLGFQAVKNADGEVRFNVEVGGYFSVKRNTTSIPLGVSVSEEQVVPFSEAVMLVFRDHGTREDRQKTRLMWLVEQLGNEAFTKLVSERMGGAEFGPHVDPGYSDVWKRRDVLGVHPQKQEGLSWVRAMLPAQRRR